MKMCHSKNNNEYAKAKAKRAAQLDFSKGLSCDSSRHQAVRASAYDDWYRHKYVTLLLNKYYPVIG